MILTNSLLWVSTTVFAISIQYTGANLFRLLTLSLLTFVAGITTAIMRVYFKELWGKDRRRDPNTRHGRFLAIHVVGVSMSYLLLLAGSTITILNAVNDPINARLILFFLAGGTGVIALIYSLRHVAYQITEVRRNRERQLAKRS